MKTSYENLRKTIANRVSASDMNDQGADQARLYVRCDSIDTFVTNLGPSVRFNGRSRLDIPGSPGISIESTQAYLPTAASVIGATIREVFTEIRAWKHPQYGDALHYFSPDGAMAEFALVIDRQEDEKAAKGYIWLVSPIIVATPKDDKLEQLVARSATLIEA